MLAFKDEGVKGNVQGVEFLLKKNKIDHFHGTGRIAAPGKVEVTFINGEKQAVEAKDIVIATGSEVAAIPGQTWVFPRNSDDDEDETTFQLLLRTNENTDKILKEIT